MAPEYSTRMRARLQDLIASPDSFTPDYSVRYAELLNHCDDLTAHSAYAMTMLLGKDSSRGYHELPAHPTFEFPDAHVPDLECQVGWHFFVGTALGSDGRHYGIQFMLWTYSLLPAPVRDALGINPIANQVMEVHVAVSREGDRHYRGAPVVVVDDIEVVANPFRYRAGENIIEALQGDAFIPLRIRGASSDGSTTPPTDVAFDLTFVVAKPPFLQGDDGAAPSVGGVGTLYYSIPRLTLAETGSSVSIGEESIPLTEGSFWFDHQWGTGFMPNGNPRQEDVRAMSDLPKPGPGGWDWFMMQFDGDLQLTLAAMHDNAHRKHFYDQTGDKPGTMKVSTSGKWIDADGNAHPVTGTMQVTDWVRAERSPDPNLYPITHVWYPNHWVFDLAGEIPEVMQHIELTPIVDGGQAGYFAPGMQYSEGAVVVTGPDGQVGRGFAESVGYVTTPDTTLALAGVAGNDVLIEQLEAPIPLGLKMRAIGHLAHPSAIKSLLAELR